MNTFGHRYLPLAFAAILVFAVSIPAGAAPKNKPRSSSGRTVTLSEAGIKLRMVPNAEQQMLPPLQIGGTLKSDGTPYYRTQDLWLHSQLLSLWGGEDVTAALASVKFPPAAKPDELVRIDEPSKWTPYDRVPEDAELRRWAECFSGERVTEITKLSGISDYSWRRLQTGKPESCLYFGIGKNSGAPRMLFLFFRWRDPQGARTREWSRLADSCALSVRVISRTSSGSESAASRSESSASSSYYAERLAQAKKSIAGMRNWYIRETPNYIFISNQRSRNDIQRLQSDLEAARGIFRRYFPPEEERACVGVVKLFGHREEYLRYAGAGFEWTGGLWNSGTRELLVSPLDPQFDSKAIEKFMREVTLHEGFHQYIFYASGEVSPALWFNEGCAQFFERSDPRHGEVGSLEKDDEARLAAAADSADDDLARFLSLDHEQFYDAREREQNYALAYALMYYLLRGAPANGENAFAAVPGRYIEALRKTKDLSRAQAIAFEGIDTRKLASRLKNFWHDKKQLRKARQKK